MWSEGTQQQGTPLLGHDRSQISTQNGEASATELDQGWRERKQIDTLCGHSFYLSAQ